MQLNMYFGNWLEQYASICVTVLIIQGTDLQLLALINYVKIKRINV